MARDVLFTIRLSNDVRNMLREVAQREDVPIAIIVRRAIKRELEHLAQEHGREIKP